MSHIYFIILNPSSTLDIISLEVRLRGCLIDNTSQLYEIQVSVECIIPRYLYLLTVSKLFSPLWKTNRLFGKLVLRFVGIEDHSPTTASVVYDI